MEASGSGSLGEAFGLQAKLIWVSKSKEASAAPGFHVLYFTIHPSKKYKTSPSF